MKMVKQKKALEIKNKKKASAYINDGMNIPVPDRTSIRPSSESEAALIKQAENPLGDPNKV